MYSIKRNIENVVARRAKNNKAILLTGPRQVGKSTLFKYLFKNVNQVTFDDDLILAQAEEDVGLFLLNNPTPLVIDEVQECPSIFNCLKIVLDNTENYGNFFLTGSQKLQLMENVSESLAGRISVIELDGLSLREINNVDFNNHFVPTENYLSEREKCLKPYRSDIWTIIHRGSYPELYANQEKEWADFYQSYVKPYMSSVLNRAIKTPKLYFRDTGLCCYLTRWLTVDTLKNGAMAGAMFETFVINEILKSYSNEGVDYDFNVFYYNGKDKKKMKENGEEIELDGEIDLIIQEDGILYPIEIKMSASPKANMASAFDVLDGVPDKKRGMGTIICLYDKKMYLRDNLVALPIEYI